MFAAKDSLLTRPSGGYVIPRSLRFRSSASAYLNRTFGTPTANLTWTYSVWIKRGKLSVAQEIFSCAADNDIYFGSSDTVSFYKNGVGVVATSTQVFRDPSAYGHFVFNSNGTTVNGYYNGSTTAFISYTGTLPNFNSAAIHTIAKAYAGTQYLDGYMAETYFVDGQALTPTSFGATNATTGVWAPIKYAGTYGANGFHLDFNSYATTAALGTDTSGNGNTWTVNNCSVTAGVTYDSMIDVPTVSAAGSNYPVMNPLASGAVLAQGNLTASYTGNSCAVATMAISSGKWYWEVTAGGTGDLIGIALATENALSGIMYPGNSSTSYGYNSSNGQKYNNSVGAAYGAAFTTNDVIGVALDLDAGNLVFYKNNSSQGTAYSSLVGTFVPAARPSSVGGSFYNFGQRAFTYTPPSGYSALNTYNLPTPTILISAANMTANIRTGTGSAANITGIAFKPGITWSKSRSAVTSHVIANEVRGTGKYVSSDTTAIEVSDAQSVTAFNSDGFSIGTAAIINTNAATYVDWMWKVSGTAGATNTDGSISCTLSANPTAGVSVSQWTGTGANGTIGHGLGVAPSMVIHKVISTTARNGIVYHISIGNTNYLVLDLLNGSSASVTIFNNTSPTSLVHTVGTNVAINASGETRESICFAPIAGYSIFGTYVGNATIDGPFIYCGFRPAFVMCKVTTAMDNWTIFDSKRNGYNAVQPALYANDPAAEINMAGGGSGVDIVSNGFKPRTGGNGVNSAQTIVFAAFAESPFKNSLAR